VLYAGVADLFITAGALAIHIFFEGCKKNIVGRKQNCVPLT
jgi:hypothetical protein